VSTALVVSIFAIALGTVVIVLVAMMLRSQRELIRRLEGATKTTIDKSDIESLRSEFATVALATKESVFEVMERQSSIESRLAEIFSSQARVECELLVVRQLSEDTRDTQDKIQVAVRKTLPMLQPTSVLAHCSFEQVFLGNSIGEFSKEEKSNWVEAVINKIVASAKFQGLSLERQVMAQKQAELLLIGVAGLYNLADSNKELIAQWAIESLASGGVPITTLAVGLITVPIHAKLGEVGFKLEELAADGQRSRAAALQSTFEGLRKLAESSVPENRSTLFELLRELDEQKHYFRRLVYEKATSVKENKLLKSIFGRGRSEAERNAEFDSFCTHLRIYKQLLGLDLLTVSILNDPDIARTSLVALQEETARLDNTLSSIQKHWEGTKDYRKDLPEPMLLDEIRLIAAHTNSQVQALVSKESPIEVSS
jgi:hypothetical protein